MYNIVIYCSSNNVTYMVRLKIIETSNFLTRKRMKIFIIFKDTYEDVSIILPVKNSWAKTIIQTFTSIFSSTELCKCNEEKFFTYSDLIFTKKMFLSIKKHRFLTKTWHAKHSQSNAPLWHYLHYSGSLFHRAPKGSRIGSQTHLLEWSATLVSKGSQLRWNFEVIFLIFFFKRTNNHVSHKLKSGE